MDYKAQVEHIVSTARFGDLIEFNYPIGYAHWAVYERDGNVIHFAVADETKIQSTFRGCLQSIFPVCGDLLLGETKIRRHMLAEINVPKGAQISVRNDCHTFTPSSDEDMEWRIKALLDKEYTYKIFKFNCEHFATFIRYGKAVCNQIPGQSKNVECVEATEEFSYLVPKKDVCKE
ncbi:phospholipase A and acyltransferase 2 [Triplophysa dalaica]|uniref:phospholipase A and acyltransferase 2 n=1 Tax=Triplophysa dalaica TaxID=1582913 RepID=UPI0024DFAD76|nr:phospholipase A and acyltransferase 2 [Triplophysa dalaica]